MVNMTTLKDIDEEIYSLRKLLHEAREATNIHTANIAQLQALATLRLSYIMEKTQEKK